MARLDFIHLNHYQTDPVSIPISLKFGNRDFEMRLGVIHYDRELYLAP
jgi:hypothetical protein